MHLEQRGLFVIWLYAVINFSTGQAHISQIFLDYSDAYCLSSNSVYYGPISLQACAHYCGASPFMHMSCSGTDGCCRCAADDCAQVYPSTPESGYSVYRVSTGSTPPLSASLPAAAWATQFYRANDTAGCYAAPGVPIPGCICYPSCGACGYGIDLADRCLVSPVLMEEMCLRSLLMGLEHVDS